MDTAPRPIPENVALLAVLGMFAQDIEGKLVALKGAIEDMLAAESANKIQARTTIAESLCTDIIGAVRTLAAVRIRALPPPAEEAS